MRFEYNKELNSVLVKTRKERYFLYCPALRKHCAKYGIPMKTYTHLYAYLTSPRCYIPKEVYGCN